MNGITYYYIIVIIASILGFLAQCKFLKRKENHKTNKLFLFLSFFILLLFLGLRENGIGIDDRSYTRIFNNVRSIGFFSYFFESTMEPGYLLLNAILGKFTDDFQIVIFFTALIMLTFIYKTFYHYSDKINLFYAIFIYGTMFFPYAFGVIRLSIAFSICFYGMTYFFKNKRVMFNIFIILASMFHYSAFVLLLLNFIIDKDFNNSKIIKRFYSILLIVIPIAFFMISNYLVPILGSRYSEYSYSGTIKFSLEYFDKLPVIIMCLLFFGAMKKIDDNSKIYLVLYSIAIVISVYSSLISFGRLQWYFNILICIIFPILIKGISKSKGKTWNFIIVPLICAYCILYSTKLISPTAQNVDMQNYTNILFKEKEY